MASAATSFATTTPNPTRSTLTTRRRLQEQGNAPRGRAQGASDHVTLG